MFEQLFMRPHALARHQDGPLIEERLRYLHHLAAQGMSRAPLQAVAQFLLTVASSLRLADRECEVISLAEINQQAILWADRPPKREDGKDRCHARAHFLLHARGWLRFLGRLQLPEVPPDPFAGLLDPFAAFMRDERGLSPQTINDRCQRTRAFLDRLGISPQSLHEVTVTQIDEALMGMIRRGGYARTTTRGLAETLRAFFRYAEMRGWCRPGLAAAIKGPCVYSQETLPTGPSWDAVRTLLATTKVDRPTDIRDHAILMVLVTYGLRAGEVVRLRLEDFDWEQELLRVERPKTGRTQTYPLSRPVGNAVLRYLKEGRAASSCREVFLARRSPRRPLSVPALYQMVSRRLRSLGVSLLHYGPHSLRHACATHLLEQGLSLKEIGDHLGHQQPNTTRIYTKVDLPGLRQVGDFDIGDML